MKKIVILFFAICIMFCSNVFAKEETIITGVINEVYITDGIGDKVQCLILTLDEEKTFNVYDDMGDEVRVSTKEIQLFLKDYNSSMNGKRITVKGNDFMEGATFYHICPIVLADAKIISETTSDTDIGLGISVNVAENLKTNYATEYKKVIDCLIDTYGASKPISEDKYSDGVMHCELMDFDGNGRVNARDVIEVMQTIIAQG